MKKQILLLGMLLSTALQAQIERIEPPFWWSGMKTSRIELLLYGKNINGLQVKSDFKVKKVTQTENPNYLFVTIETQGKKAGNYSLTLTDTNGKEQTLSYELKERRKDSKKRKSFDSSDVIYLLMPDRFANGNPSNDSNPNLTEQADPTQPGGRHGGDIEGIINHLDYIQSLGATALWSTPLCQDNDPTYSYHGYGQSDVYQIDARYGTNQDYQRLGKELHKRGMKLIMDYVTNHWGGAHWLIKDLPTYDWLHQFPGYGQSTYRMTTQMDPYASQYDKKYCAEGWFTKDMPDLNQSNPLVLNYLTQNAIWWIEFADLDGLRVDTYSYNDKKGIAQWTQNITKEYPNLNIVGEVWLHDQAQISYWQKDSPISAIQRYNTHLPSVMDFTLHDALGQSLNSSPSWDRGMIQVYENFVNDFLYKDPLNLLIFAENHDTQRINQIYPKLEDYKLIIAMLATMRGIPQLYYGSEIGMRGDKSQGDAHIRQDFPGGWQNDPQNAFLASGRTPLQNQYFDFTAKLMNWRKSKTVIHTGKTLQYLPMNEVYVYFRYNTRERVMVIINANTEAQTFSLDRFSEGIQQHTHGTDVISGKKYPLQGEFTLSGKTALVLELSK